MAELLETVYEKFLICQFGMRIIQCYFLSRVCGVLNDFELV